MIIYKINILDELKKQGYTTYTLRKNRIISESTLQKLRDNKMISIETLNILCKLLNAQPGELIVYINEPE